MANQTFQKIWRIILTLFSICLLISIGMLVFKAMFLILMLIIELILGAIVVGILYSALLILFRNKKK